MYRATKALCQLLRSATEKEMGVGKLCRGLRNQLKLLMSLVEQISTLKNKIREWLSEKSPLECKQSLSSLPGLAHCGIYLGEGRIFCVVTATFCHSVSVLNCFEAALGCSQCHFASSLSSRTQALIFAAVGVNRKANGMIVPTFHI